MNLTKNIKEICKRKNITVTDAEKKAGIADNSVYKWDRHSPSAKTLKKMADALEIKVDELMSGKEEKC